MMTRTIQEESEFYVPDPELEVAMEVARELGQPLLITGEPGTGKTQAAYYAARKWLSGEVLHFQVKSDTKAQHLLYHFDTVAYFHAAHLAQLGGPPGSARGAKKSLARIDKRGFVEGKELWKAFELGRQRKQRQVLLIDEIDKAPKDFPNDLLDELDRYLIRVREVEGMTMDVPPAYRPVVFITSNSERRLPEPFLRRCVYHNIEFSADLVRQILERRKAADFPGLSEDVVKLALRCFLALRARGGRPASSTAEFLCWLRMVAHAAEQDEKVVERISEERWSDFPFKGLLVKDANRLRELAK